MKTFMKNLHFKAFGGQKQHNIVVVDVDLQVTRELLDVPQHFRQFKFEIAESLIQNATKANAKTNGE